jgi:uncharacterized membrane protein
MSRRGTNKKTTMMTPIIELKDIPPGLSTTLLSSKTYYWWIVMLESCFDAIIWYVFEGTQRQISLFLFSIIIQTIQFFDHFHEKLHEVSSSSKLESCLRFKNRAPSLGHNIFKAAHVSNLKNVLSTAFSMCFILVPVWGKAPFPQTGTRMKCIGFYAKFNVEVYHHHGTSHQDSCGNRKAFSSPPAMCSFSWIITLCTLQKDWSFLLPNSPRKVHF